jgi:hypothetical protein
MPTKKTTKTVTVKKEEPKKAVAKKAPAKKEPVKKEPVTKEPVKKEPVKKASVKKTVAKKAPVKKAEVPADLMSEQEYINKINWKKGEAHAMDWLYIEINAGDLNEEFEAGKNNLKNVCNAIMNCMLEGDTFMVEPAEADHVNRSLTVRYYCDNLSEERKKFSAK